MTLSHLFLGALSPRPSFFESIMYQFNGLLIVFVALGALWLLAELTGCLFKRHEKKLAKRTGAPTAPASSQAQEERELSNMEITAIVASAVHVALRGQAHRVISVTPAPQYHHAWVAEGRRDIFTSHKTR